MPKDDGSKNYKKDYAKQIKDHIQEIIKTGKDVKISTLAAYLSKKQKNDGKEANLLIKLQQLKTAQS